MRVCPPRERSVIEYDASLSSLLHPETMETLFQRGQTLSVTQIAAEMARLAYYSFDPAKVGRLHAAVALAGFTGLKAFSKRLDTQCFVASRDDGMAVIAFRGTQPESFFDIGVD